MTSKKCFSLLLILTVFYLSSCGKLKTADSSSNESPSYSAPATQIYTDSGALIGNFLGYAQYSSLLIIQFYQGPTAFLDFTYGNGHGALQGLDINMQQGGFQCYYSSADCSGDCNVNADALLKNSIVYDGTQYRSFTGKESTSSLTSNYSYRGYTIDSSGIQQPGTCTAVVSGNVKVARPSQSWTLPTNITLPINNIYFGY